MKDKSFLKSLIIVAFIASCCQAKLEWGLCNSTPTTHEQGSLNVTKLMGIWYEFLGTEDLKAENNYDCASWLMMQDKVDDPIFSVIFTSQDLSTNDTSVKMFDMDCSPTQFKTNTAVCYFSKEQPKNLLQAYTTHKLKDFYIIATDYYSFLVAKVCQNFGLYHYSDYVVLTRDKDPSKYHRRKIREVLKPYDLNKDNLYKGKLVECWGEDFFMAGF